MWKGQGRLWVNLIYIRKETNLGVAWALFDPFHMGVPLPQG